MCEKRNFPFVEKKKIASPFAMDWSKYFLVNKVYSPYIEVDLSCWKKSTNYLQKGHYQERITRGKGI